MRQLAALILIGLVSLFLVGCARTNLESARDHTHRVQRNMQKDCRNIAEDWDRFWLVDQPSHLTPNNM